MWNDAKAGLKASGHWAHTGLFLLACNVRHGPYQEDRRQDEMMRALGHFFVLHYELPLRGHLVHGRGPELLAAQGSFQMAVWPPG